MKVLVTGVKGQLGFDVIRVLKEKDIDFIGVDIDELDITLEKDVKDFINFHKPSVIVHCAAYTAVDKAEEEKDKCYQINVLGTKYLAEAAKEIDAKFVYISTDYVFDGKGDKPFDVNTLPNPVNYYGKSKYQGEVIVQELLEKYYIIRISWVFGINGNNFIKTMLKLAESRDEITVVSDQIGSPTYTFDLAYAIVEVISTDDYGVHHITNDGYCSWSDFAREVFIQTNKNIKIFSIYTKDYPTIAKRPLNSRMKKNKYTLRLWKEALSDFLSEIK